MARTIPIDRPATAYRRIGVIVNPATRRDVARVVAAIERAVPPGVEIEIQRTRTAGEAVDLARAARGSADLVVAVGGDGTVADVATGIRDGGVPLGIVPAGSTNIIARELGIPKRPEAAARLLFGRHRLIQRDVGVCGDRCFLHMAGAGFDSRFFAATNPALKRRVGWLAYLPPAARALGEAPARFQIVADGQQIELTSPLVLIANGGSIIAPWLRLDPEIHADDGWLDLLAFTAVKPLTLARTLGRFALLRLPGSHYLYRLKAHHISLSATPVVPIEFDGDVGQTTPAEFTIAPKAIEVVVPAQ